MDSTFDFERRRNRPVKYDRELYHQTVQAMKRIEQIRSKRERVHYEERMKNKSVQELQESLRDLEQLKDTVISPAAVKARVTIKIEEEADIQPMEVSSSSSQKIQQE